MSLLWRPGHWTRPQYRQVRIANRTVALNLMQCAAHRRRRRAGPFPGTSIGPFPGISIENVAFNSERPVDSDRLSSCNPALTLLQNVSKSKASNDLTSETDPRPQGKLRVLVCKPLRWRRHCGNESLLSLTTMVQPQIRVHVGAIYGTPPSEMSP